MPDPSVIPSGSADLSGKSGLAAVLMFAVMFVRWVVGGLELGMASLRVMIVDSWANLSQARLKAWAFVYWQPSTALLIFLGGFLVFSVLYLATLAWEWLCRTKQREETQVSDDRERAGFAVGP